MANLRFRGETYNDDRMFVLYICKCLVIEDDFSITTTICHDTSPAGHRWCLVTYRNTARFPICRVNHFDTEERAALISDASSQPFL